VVPPTPDLKLPLPAVAVRDHAVHENTRIPDEVHCLGRLPQHRQPQIAVHHEGLGRAERGYHRAESSRPERHQGLAGAVSRGRPAAAGTAPLLSRPLSGYGLALWLV
jgi:hypothetical protein